MGQDVTFLIATQAEKGSHKNIAGLTQRVNSHSAAFNHARRRNRKKSQHSTTQTSEHTPIPAEYVNQHSPPQDTAENALFIPVAPLMKPHGNTLALSNTSSITRDSNNEREPAIWPPLDAFQSKTNVFNLYDSCSWSEGWRDLDLDESSRTNSDISSNPTTPGSSTSSDTTSSPSELTLRPSSEIYGKLDPFIRLPVELSAYERNLLHYCVYSIHSQ